MSAFWLLMIILALAAVGFIMGRRRAISSVQGDGRLLHSLPNYYGFNVAMLAFVPAVLVLGAWVIIQPMLISGQVSTHIPAALYEDAGQLNLIMSDVKRVADGLDAAILQGVLSADDASLLNTETTDVRALLGEVGVALGSDVDPLGPERHARNARQDRQRQPDYDHRRFAGCGDWFCCRHDDDTQGFPCPATLLKAA